MRDGRNKACADYVIHGAKLEGRMLRCQFVVCDGSESGSNGMCLAVLRPKFGFRSSEQKSDPL